ncbi:MAG: hypothetical protein ACOY3F_05545 [Bacillota bacterium]
MDEGHTELGPRERLRRYVDIALPIVVRLLRQQVAAPGAGSAGEVSWSGLEREAKAAPGRVPGAGG